MIAFLLIAVVGLIVFAFAVAIIAWPFLLIRQIRKTRRARKLDTK